MYNYDRRNETLFNNIEIWERKDRREISKRREALVKGNLMLTKKIKESNIKRRKKV